MKKLNLYNQELTKTSLATSKLQTRSVGVNNPTKSLESSRLPTIRQLVFSMCYLKVFLYSGKLYLFNGSFLFMNLFLDSDILTFQTIIIMAAFDFWTVKNITGRIMVGLRWWSEIDENGVEKWVFESNDQKKEVGATDSFVFWSSLYMMPIIWAIFMFVDLISLKIFWVIVAFTCMLLSGANVVGYYKCQKDH